MENQYISKIDETLGKLVEKFDRQIIQIQDLTNKVDFYREAQTEQARKLEFTDQTATQAMSSTKAAHKRLDAFEQHTIKDLEETLDNYITKQEAKEVEKEKERKADEVWRKRAIITAILGWTSVILGAVIKFFW